MGIRRKGREVALQTLYALSYEIIQQEDQLNYYLESYSDKLAGIVADLDIKDNSKILIFAEDLLHNTILKFAEIDKAIKAHSDNWKLENIAKVDIAILRIAIYEILFTSTPAAVIMNEAIEISKKFCSESSGRFINGILNAVAEGKKNER
jgi:N utilization substance protein B